MLKAHSLARRLTRLLTAGLTASILVIASTRSAQAQPLPGGTIISSNQASFNYSICTKTQNKDVLAVIDGPVVLAQHTTGSLNGDTIFNIINEFRKTKGLAPFEKDANICSLATARAAEVFDEINSGKTLHSGLYNRNLPYWVTENAKYGSTEQGAVAWWISSPLHHRALVSNAKYSCGACYDDVCVEEFTSYIPK